MGLSDKILPHYTYDDYIKWEGRWELIDGHPIAMSPLPIPQHQQTSADIIYEFKDALQNNCEACKVYSPLDYKISDDTTVQPDILIVCGKIEKQYLDFAPELVVEILSPSTALRDRNTKYLIYKQQGVKYYLIVDIEKKLIEIHQLMQGEYIHQPYENGFVFQFKDNCTIAPLLNKIWA